MKRYILKIEILGEDRPIFFYDRTYYECLEIVNNYSKLDKFFKYKMIAL